MTYHSPPKVPGGFPELRRVKPKTPLRGGGGLRARWKDADGNLYEWDSRHGTVEKYDKRGNHLGEFDPDSGERVKASEAGRTIVP